MKFDERYWLFEEKVRDYRLESVKKCYEEILSEIKTMTGNPKRRIFMLDIGCGYGYFLRICFAYGFKCAGIDISKYALERLKNTLIDVILADAQSGFPLKSNSIDVVVMLEVIEHLEKPTKVAKEISRVLKTNGILYITTPNRNALGRLMLRHKWYGFLDKTHRMLFTPSSLCSLIEKEGFNIIKIYEPFRVPLLKHIGIVSRIGLGGQIRLVAKKA